MVGYSRRDVTESSDVMEKLNRYRSKKLWLCHQSVTRPETADMKSLIKNFTSISLNSVLWQLDVFHFAPSTCLPPFDWVTFTFMLWHFVLIVFCLCIRDPLYNLCHDLQTPDSQWTWLNNRGKKREKEKRRGLGFRGSDRSNWERKARLTAAGLRYKRSSEAARRC